MRCYLILVWICLPSLILGFGIQLEGLIDLGPNWDYKYKLSPLSTTELFTELQIFSYSQKGRKDMELTNVGIGNEKDQAISPSDNLLFKKNIDLVNNLTTVTQTTSNHNDKISTKKYIKKSDVRNQNRQKFQQNSDQKLKKKKKRKNYNDRSKSNESNKDVSNGEKNIIRHENNNKHQREIDRLGKFMKDVYKQSMKVWKKMLKTVRSGDVKSKVNSLKKYFKINYREFMKQFKTHKMKTKLGTQKFVFNAIETSDRIMQRLVNSLSTYENSTNVGNIFQQMFEKEKRLLYAHACKKFGVCRTNDDFGNYLIELINIILQTDNAKIKQAADALTEVVKTNDFTETIDRITQDKLRKKIENIELWDPFIVKSMFVILRSVLSHKNQPMVITALIDEELSNKTVAFHEIIDILNKNVYKSENMTGRWIEIKKQLEEWRDGIRKEIQTAFQSLIELMKKGLEKLDTTAAQEVDKNTIIILRPMQSKVDET